MSGGAGRTWAWWVGTLGGVGCMPWLPGTVGTLVGAGVWFLTTRLPQALYWQVGLLAVLFCVGVWVSGRVERELGVVDAREIVIDEGVGALLVFVGVPANLVAVMVGVAAFRFFDIVKPFPISRLQRLRGGWGIMADDIAAALVSHVVVRAVVWLLGDLRGACSGV